MVYLQTLGLLFLCYALSYRIMHGLAQASARSYLMLRLILFPGVVLHELAHALACLVTGTPIHRISFWTDSGGVVVHEKPRWAWITQPLISFAPLPVGIASLLGLSNYLEAKLSLGTAVILFLMVSIAGTLGPSKTDIGPALEGSFFFILVGTVTYFSYPQLLNQFAHNLAHFNQSLLFVVLLLGVMWLAIILLHNTWQHFIRR